MATLKKDRVPSGEIFSKIKKSADGYSKSAVVEAVVEWLEIQTPVLFSSGRFHDTDFKMQSWECMLSENVGDCLETGDASVWFLFVSCV